MQRPPSAASRPPVGASVICSRIPPMMEAERILAHPPHPPSEVEWEDLLLRLEVMTKAIRIAAEEPTDGVDAPEVVRALVGREVAARDFLERAAGEPSSAPAEPTPGSGPIQ